MNMTFSQGPGTALVVVEPQPKKSGAHFLAAVGLFLLVIAFSLGPQTSMLNEDGAGGLIRQVSYLSLLVLAMLSARPWNDPGSLVCMPLPLLLALVICAISLIWSPVPGIGLRRLVLTASVAWTAAILVRQLQYEGSLTVLRSALFVILIANYIAVFAFPLAGIHQFSDKIDLALVGDWCGIMKHKNFAGAIMALTVMLFLFDAQRVPLALRIGVLGAALIFLIFSQSKTSVGMLAGSVIIGYLFGKTSFSWRLALIPAIAIGAILGMIYLNIYRYAFVQLVNDPETFTGRIVIWRHMLSYIGDHPWFGTGYGSFWMVGQNGPIFLYSSDWDRNLGSGHNGFLDLAATLGIPLAMICIALLVIWPVIRLLVSGRTTRGKGALLLALIIFCVGHNVTETGFLERDVITNVMLFLTITLLWELTSKPAMKSGWRRR